MPLASRIRPRGAEVSATLRLVLSACCRKLAEASTWRNHRRAESAANIMATSRARSFSRELDFSTLEPHHLPRPRSLEKPAKHRVRERSEKGVVCGDQDGDP